MPVFLYDGDCAFCSGCARFAERWIPTSATIVAWQHADLDELGVTASECDEAVQWIADPAGPSPARVGPEAIADLLRTSRPWWRLAATVLGSRPGLAVAWPVYRWVSRHRDRMPGGTATCALPHDERGQR